MLDIARDRRKIFKKEKEKQGMAKQTTATNIFLLLLFCMEKNIFC